MLRLLLATIAVASLPACRVPTYAYRAQRLDLDAHRTTWRERLSRVRPAREYARALERLNKQDRPPFDLSDGASVAEAEVMALLFHPSLRVARLNARVPLMSAQQAGLRQDPSFSVDLLRIVESVANPWVLASGLSFTLPLHGQRAADRAQALCEATEAVRKAFVAEWEVVTALRDDWNRWSANGERIALLKAHLTRVDEVLALAKTMNDAGQIGDPQLRLLQLERVARQGELQALASAHHAQAIALKGDMGLVPGADVKLVPAFSADPRGLPFPAERRKLVRNNLQLALAKAAYAVADTALRHEIRKQHPTLKLGPLVETDEGTGRIGAAAGFTLPIWNRNRRAIVEACAARQAAKGAFEARFEMLLNELTQARSQCAATKARSIWLEEHVAPLADEQLADLQELSRLGDLDVLILKDALGTVLDTKLKLIEARLERAIASNRRRALIDPLRTPNAVSVQR